MILSWWGTAALRLVVSGRAFWVDPYLSRHPASRPKVELKPDQVRGVEAVFLTHGHFDHAMDAPSICNRNEAPVYCHTDTAKALIGNGLAPELAKAILGDQQTIRTGPLEATAHFSRHISFDMPLILRTLPRIGMKLPRLHGLVRRWPCGRVLAWRLAAEGRELLIFGSAGSDAEELRRLSQRPTDILCVPLQGHSHICDIALEYVRCLKPRVVIPIHQDDFYPPVSRMVDIGPFVRGLAMAHPGTSLLLPEVGQPVEL